MNYSNIPSLFASKSYDKIISEFCRDSLDFPESEPLTVQYIAASFLYLGRYSDCIDFCSKVYPIHQLNTGFISVYGSALRSSGNRKHALDLYHTYINTDPNNPIILNNYANLLIDEKRFGEAHQILNNLAQLNIPNIADVVANLNRLKFLVETSEQTESGPHNVTNSDKQDKSLPDPLYLAFLPENTSNNNDSVKESKPVMGHHSITNLAFEELLSMAGDLLETNPVACLSECTLLLEKSGTHASIYSLAGQAYLRLKLFADAELAFHNSWHLGSHSLDVLINLASLAHMRRDYMLAESYLLEASELSPDNELIRTLKNSLSSSQASHKSAPFQVDLSQASTEIKRTK